MRLFYVILLFITSVVFVSEPMADSVFDRVDFKSTKSGLQFYDVALVMALMRSPVMSYLSIMLVSLLTED